MLGPVTQEMSDISAALQRSGPSRLSFVVPGDACYADIIAGVAVTRAPGSGLSPARLGWILLGVGWRETELGLARGCDIKGPGCTGDFGARLATQHRQGSRYQVSGKLPDGWAPPRDKHGMVLSGPYAIPADGRGYGRSEWQHDYDAHPEVTDSMDGAGKFLWENTRWACDQAAARLLADLKVLQVEQQTIAAYNCGVGGVKSALAAGLDVDAHTTGYVEGSGGYSKWILDHLNQWGANL